MVSLYKKNFTMKSGILFLVSILLSATLWSQSNEDRLQRLMEDDPEGLNTIIAAEPDVQAAVLEAATQPELLSQLQTIQDRSRAAFEGIVSPYSQETQQIFWDLTRYPNLVARLAKDGKGTESGAAYVLRDYPEAIHARAKEANKYYYTLLVKIDDLEKSTNQDFNNVLNRYPKRTQDVFRLLLNNPEALSTLTQRNYTAETLADLYRNDSNWITYRLRELNQERTQQSSAQLEDWRNSVQSDPEAVQELTQSAQEYAREYGYDDEYYGEDFDDDAYSSNNYDYNNNYNDNRQRPVVNNNYYYYNYPYWFGYPTWYRAPRWRPVPVWYDYGFVWRPNRPIVIVRMPSFYFVNWYFYRPWNHYRYARLSNCFVDYYYRYPRSYNTIVINVNNWKYRNRAVVSDDWLRDRNNRVERLREFGQFEQERRTYNRDNRERAISQRDYLEKNENKFARLTKVAPRNADRNTFPERERTVETPRRSTNATEPRTRQETPRREPERTNPDVERRSYEPRRSEPTEQPRTRTREEVQPRENPTRTPERTETQPRQSERNWQPERREPVQRETPPRSNETERNRTIERQPTREMPRRPTETQERTRTPQVERRSTPSQQPSRSVERSRSSNTQERSKSEPTKKEGSTRKRGGNGE